MLFKKGDKVKVISNLEEWKEVEENLTIGEKLRNKKLPGYSPGITYDMVSKAGKTITIEQIENTDVKTYFACGRYWSEWMFEKPVSILEIE